MGQIQKMEFKTEDTVNSNVEKISKLFPNVVSEGKIDFDKLKQELTSDIIEGDEAYDFTWVGKKASMVEANKPTTMTLRPCIEESVNFDTTENLYIEGDNLEVLKLLQKSYQGKIKCIYIDPPYNTGNDFIYNDDFKIDSEEYKSMSGELDDEGNRLVKNTDSNGRFHSDWCSMMYSRLKLAHNLMCDQGVIFISIDDNEQENLKKICNEIFGENNLISCAIWNSISSVLKQSKFIRKEHEYLLIYTKDKTKTVFNKLQNSMTFDNIDNDPKGAWFSSNAASPNQNSNTNKFAIKLPNGEECIRNWKFSKEEYEEGKIPLFFKGGNVPRLKIYEKDYNKDSKIQSSIFKDFGSITTAKSELNKIFGYIPFDTPKPVALMKQIIELSTNNNDIILDFFSGSASLAHAVIEENIEKNKNLKFIMVQLPEKTDESSEAYKAGFKNICEIGKERIRRAGKKIKEENKDTKNIENLDIGFRVLKLDSSNMKDVYYNPDDYTQDLLTKLESNIKDDRNADDLLFASIIDRGLDLTKTYRKEKIDGKTVIIYNEEGEVPEFIACFDENVTEKCITEIAKMKPLKVTFRDSSFEDSSSKINLEEIFKMYSPDTRIKVF